LSGFESSLTFGVAKFPRRDPLLADPTYRATENPGGAWSAALNHALALVFLGQVLFLLDLTF